ncbi:MAG: hypothetical protein ACRBBP_01055 [Bdellovibrionales bacterium]
MDMASNLKTLFKKNLASLLFFFASLSLLSNTALANPQCSSFLKPAHEVITTNFSEATSRPTVEVGHEIHGPHGGKLFIVKKNGETWVSQFTTFKFDLQGDPRWFIGSVGESLAAFFGFRIIDSQTMTIPDAREFQLAIDKVNKVLIAEGKEPVLIRFKTDDLTEAPMQGYIDAFRALELPLASGGNHLVHDMSFHTGTLFMPNRIIRAAHTRTSFIMEFTSFLRRREHEHTDLIKSVNKYVKNLLVRSIDNGTGFGNLTMIAFKAEDPFVETQINELVGRMHDSEATGAPVELGLTAPLHLAVGTIGPLTHYRNGRFTYTSPSPTQNGLRLKDYTLDMFTQFLETAISINHKRDNSARSSTLKAEVADFLRTEMEAFAKTPEGKDSNFNLLTVFDENIALKGSQRGFEITSEVADNLTNEFMNRALEIENAAKTHIQSTGFSAPLLLTNPISPGPE